MHWTGSNVSSEQAFTVYVDATASAASQLPTGWTVATTGTGIYVITHNLALADGKLLRVVGAAVNPPMIGCSLEVTVEAASATTVRMSRSGVVIASAFYLLCFVK